MICISLGLGLELLARHVSESICVISHEALLFKSIASAAEASSHGTDRHIVFKYVTTSLIDDFIHQVDQVRVLIRLGVLLSEVLDRIVHELLESALRGL
jgi:hypothetical protein